MKRLGFIGLFVLTACAHREPAPPPPPQVVAAPQSPQAALPPAPTPSPASTPAPAAASQSAPAQNTAPAIDAAPAPAATNAPAPTKPAVIANRPKPPANSRAPASASTAAPSATTDAAAPKPVAAPPPLDLNALEQRLRDTRAIGVFTKLSLKNQVDDLLDTVRDYHAGQHNATLQGAKQQYDLLLLKVLTLLQDGDPPLASSIRGSRDAMWNLLADREQFQKLRL